MDDSRIRVTLISLAAMTILLLAGLAAIDYKKKLVSEELTHQKLKSESLLSEKLLLAKDLSKKEKAQNKLDQLVDQLNDSLADQRSKLLKTMRGQSLLRSQLLQTRKNNEERYLLAITKLDSTTNETVKLSNQVRAYSDSIELVTRQNSNLEDAVALARLTAFDKTFIKGVRKNERKITSKARRTNKLIASVLVPGEFENLKFTIEGPDGEVVNLQSDELTARTVGQPDVATASINEDTYLPFLQPKEVEIIYDPHEKLRPGIYTFQIFNQEQYVGSMQVELK